MKAILYARVSTDEQAKEGYSLDAQRSKLTAYAALYDMEVIAVFADEGVSAKSLKRPALQKALGMLKSGEADALIVAKLDRLSRSVKDWNTLIEHYFGEKAGKQLMSVSDSIDTRTAAGRLVLNVLMSVFQWEREAIGERTRDALHYKTGNGERVTRTRFGFDVAEDGVKLVPNPAEQAVIDRMLALRGEGKGYKAIANCLNAEGVKTKEGGKRWESMTVSRVLKRASRNDCGRKSPVAA